MPRYLITGGAGFIGSNLVKKLVENGESVRVLDNLSTGKLANIAQFVENKKIEFIKGDFTNLEVSKRATEKIDYVLHHGAVASVPRSVDEPVLTNNANILGTLNLLIAAREAGVKRFVYAASSAAYGDSPVMPKEETMPVAPKSPYAVQKLTGEYYCQNFYALHGLETVCLRYFNVFGPNQDPSSAYSAVIPVFIKQMLAGKSPVIYGDGTTSRDFTYVANNVQANLLACRPENICAGEVINIACGYEISLNELVARINQILGTNITPKYEAERLGDVKHSLADITKAKKLLNYAPEINFDEGLTKTVEFYRQH